MTTIATAVSATYNVVDRETGKVRVWHLSEGNAACLSGWMNALRRDGGEWLVIRCDCHD